MLILLWTNLVIPFKKLILKLKKKKSKKESEFTESHYVGGTKTNRFDNKELNVEGKKEKQISM